MFAIIFMSIVGLMFSTGYEYVGEFDEAVTGGDVHAFYKQSAKNCFLVVLVYVGVLFLSIGCCVVGNCRKRRCGRVNLLPLPCFVFRPAFPVGVYRRFHGARFQFVKLSNA